MTNEIVSLFKGNGFPGVEIHIPVDPQQKAIFCEGHDRAIALSEALVVHCGLRTSLGREQEIVRASENRKQVKAFPIHISGLNHDNFLNVSVRDPVIAAGLVTLLDDRHIHSHIKVLPIDDSKRQTGGSRNGNGNGR